MIEVGLVDIIDDWFAKPTDDQSWPIRLHESYKFWWITLKSLYVSQVGQGVGGDETWGGGGGMLSRNGGEGEL